MYKNDTKEISEIYLISLPEELKIRILFYLVKERREDIERLIKETLLNKRILDIEKINSLGDLSKKEIFFEGRNVNKNNFLIILCNEYDKFIRLIKKEIIFFTYFFRYLPQKYLMNEWEKIRIETFFWIKHEILKNPNYREDFFGIEAYSKAYFRYVNYLSFFILNGIYYQLYLSVPRKNKDYCKKEYFKKRMKKWEEVIERRIHFFSEIEVENSLIITESGNITEICFKNRKFDQKDSFIFLDFIPDLEYIKFIRSKKNKLIKLEFIHNFDTSDIYLPIPYLFSRGGLRNENIVVTISLYETYNNIFLSFLNILEKRIQIKIDSISEEILFFYLNSPFKIFENNYNCWKDESKHIYQALDIFEKDALEKALNEEFLVLNNLKENIFSLCSKKIEIKEREESYKSLIFNEEIKSIHLVNVVL